MEDFILVLNQYPDSMQHKEVKLCVPTYSEVWKYAVATYGLGRVESIHREGDECMGQVFFYEICKGETLKLIGCTDKMPFHIAIDIYANTPNPASQILRFFSEEDYERIRNKLEHDVTDRNWLDQLFECI